MEEREPGVRAATQETGPVLEGEVRPALHKGHGPCELCLVVKNQSCVAVLSGKMYLFRTVTIKKDQIGHRLVGIYCLRAGRGWGDGKL